jgi:ribose-phosphate pyrophosphokinase
MESPDDPLIAATETAAPLGAKVAGITGGRCHVLRTERFANENLVCRAVGLDAEARDVAFLQSFPSAVSDRVLELLFGLRSLSAAAPRRLTAVLPYVPYSRSDRPEARGEPVPARLFAELLECAGAQRVVAFDLHSPQLAGFFRVPAVELSALPLLAGKLRAWELVNPVVVSPDLGGAKRAARLAAELGCPVALVTKERTPERVVVRSLAGDVRDRAAVLFDDEIATGSTLVAAAEVVLARGARSVCAAATHGVFAGDALERLERSPLERILVADTIPLRSTSPRLEVVSIAGELAAFLGGSTPQAPPKAARAARRSRAKREARASPAPTSSD